MGRGIIEAGLFRTERIGLEERTSDPADPEPNEAWLRVDIKPQYEDADGNTQTGVAEYRVANADGSVDAAPVAQLGDSTGDNVIDKVRAHVEGGGSPTGTGFVPHATSGASYGRRRLEHPSAGQVAMHNALTASAIPDSVVALYDARELSGFSGGDSVSTWTAVEGPDITGQGTYRNSGIESQPSVEHDGVDDGFTASGSTISQPYTIYAVINPDFGDSESDYRAVVAEPSSTSSNLAWNGNNKYWEYFAGSGLAGSSTAGRQILSVRVDGTNSVIREDGTQTGSGDAGTNSLDLVAVGIRDGVLNFLGDVGYAEVHDGVPDNGLDGREQEIIDDWGLSV